MASMTEDRIEVGTCDLGNVFIFHKAERDGYTDKLVNDTWMVRAGNHTIATVDSEARARAIAESLCGIENVTNEYVAEAPAPPPSPEMEKVVAATRKKVSG